MKGDLVTDEILCLSMIFSLGDLLGKFIIFQFQMMFYL